MATAVNDLVLKSLTEREIAAACERMKRANARKGLIDFASYVFSGYKQSPPHIALADKLEAVSRGEITRLIVNMPRRHGKSLMVSQIFPCWLMGRIPRIKIVQCGYAESLTITHSRKARDILISDRFHNLYPNIHHRPETAGQEVIAPYRQTAHEWGTGEGGSYYAVGIGGGLSGRGFNIGLIDDVHKDRADAQSPLKRDKAYDWFRAVFYPAQDVDDFFPNAAIILIGTKWHPDDMYARVKTRSLVESDDGASDKWDELVMPAIADGKALWPDRWGLDKLAKIKLTIGSREFSAQYQQDPKDVEGGLMKREWFRIVSECPRSDRWARYWDLAGTEKSAKSSNPDWTVGALVAVVGGVWYIKNMRRFRGTEERIRQAVKQCASLDPYGTRVYIEQEPGAGSKNLIAAYKRDVLPGYFLVGVPSIKDKVLRAGPLMSASEAGNVCLVGSRDDKGNVVAPDWAEAFLSEAESLPNGEHDDTIDAVAGAINMLSGGAPFQSEQVKTGMHPVEFSGMRGTSRKGLIY